ncbi:GNAT family N-acetyltransferase [Paenibacillus eucommiae]|uniref:Ribosomal protein S18 acetylase RimI-like enzyme n=1 Tax=Paenibacillus eucommiae TaxID=1355755 RepID=A0ABS4J2M8_9BACL|nr:GNAT family N-acetyltransferase [Paenibacillus eucommiae]MBP1994101.1 ribosomal protein S18 acetylase RimI-like enzyme [Paenibacillus eucommiae]
MTLIWRKAAEPDLEVLAAMNKQLIDDEGSRNPMNLDQLRERMRDWMTTDWEIDLLCNSSGIVGYVLYQFRPASNSATRNEAYLRQYFIKRDYRNQGYGKEGIELLLTERLEGIETITIEVLETNPNGMRFWRKAGFLPYSTTMKRI